jgi:hypothetical protein
MTKYFIAHAGLHGYLPQCSTVGTSRKAVAEEMASIHDLTATQQRRLSQDMHLELDLAEDGNEYIEIIEIDKATYDEWSNE